LKDGSELAEVTTGGRLFHTREAATPNARREYVARLLHLIQTVLCGLLNCSKHSECCTLAVYMYIVQFTSLIVVQHKSLAAFYH